MYYGTFWRWMWLNLFSGCLHITYFDNIFFLRVLLRNVVINSSQNTTWQPTTNFTRGCAKKPVLSVGKCLPWQDNLILIYGSVKMPLRLTSESFKIWWIYQIGLPIFLLLKLKKKIYVGEVGVTSHKIKIVCTWQVFVESVWFLAWLFST